MILAVSVFDLFSIGIGPSSSHTVGPMRAAAMFAAKLSDSVHVTSVRAELFGSLGATGHGHGTPKAVLLGLQGFDPETVDVTLEAPADGRIVLPSGREVAVEMVLHRRRSLPEHPNGMTFTALAADGAEVLRKKYFSVGGGFVVGDLASRVRADHPPVPHPFLSGTDLLGLTRSTGLSISRLMLENESAWRAPSGIRDGLLHIWSVMSDCIDEGLNAEGVLPGGLKVRRRAASTARQLRAAGDPAAHSMEWLTAYAMAVNEQNAAGGRVVTAPTNGAAGIIPAVLRYYLDFVPGANGDGVVRFLLAAGAIGLLFKENASISGAEVGCQGEVGSACAMAAAGLAEVLGGTPEQVENAAEIGMEHNLGLTCDPVGGLVQIPCIERNGMAAVKAVTAARMALRGDGRHHVSLDKVIKTMKETGADMKIKYKETSRGGLAVNVIEC
ncbi:putative L-serine dehydratase [Actinoplanes missouriensis 431]|uniref:L-serine dehydratase n=1 Tax=Actinoplanes missouriensis (strain ATCC 14538 / DSM 43046 / CBS 188.64 / JCM 3121 / NBRC 102363 / NCIMB 12654 / NRRL B-3342 / UNCC 431) TaxID=512565 RepID=I0HA55_ACTM4|nr:L-serine ammonia-lyase [Actinoplanes missouriensis]BAL89892.1 putative L-serine dehydratase [Actinoplanes missouriensis 431]